jgi:AcrR family transcriptional regulator
MADSVPAGEPDGRRARSERTRETIIDALLELIHEGNLGPTAQQVSDRSGIGIRTLFRHFEGMESLFATVDARERASYQAVFAGGDRTGTLAERIQRAAQRHADGYEKVERSLMLAQAQRWRYGVLRENYAHYQRALRKDLENWLPELKSMPRKEREAVDAIASPEMWLRLREHQRLGKKASVDIVASMIKSLMACK